MVPCCAPVHAYHRNTVICSPADGRAQTPKSNTSMIENATDIFDTLGQRSIEQTSSLSHDWSETVLSFATRRSFPTLHYLGAEKVAPFQC